MPVTPVVNDAPYPFSATFTSNGGKHAVKFAGSGWRTSAGKISVDLLMDGNVIATPQPNERSKFTQSSSASYCSYFDGAWTAHILRCAVQQHNEN